MGLEGLDIYLWALYIRCWCLAFLFNVAYFIVQHLWIQMSYDLCHVSSSTLVDPTQIMLVFRKIIE